MDFGWWGVGGGGIRVPVSLGSGLGSGGQRWALTGLEEGQGRQQDVVQEHGAAVQPRGARQQRPEVRRVPAGSAPHQRPTAPPSVRTPNCTQPHISQTRDPPNPPQTPPNHNPAPNPPQNPKEQNQAPNPTPKPPKPQPSPKPHKPQPSPKSHTETPQTTTHPQPPLKPHRNPAPKPPKPHRPQPTPKSPPQTPQATSQLQIPPPNCMDHNSAPNPTAHSPPKNPTPSPTETHPQIPPQT